MNNAFVKEEDKKEETSAEMDVRLMRMVEAIDSLVKREDWKELEELHFKKEEERVERLLLSESKRDELDEKTIYRLQGELKWAKRYANLTAFGKLLKHQLDNKKKHE